MSIDVNLIQAFASFTEHWSPRVAVELNGQQVKVVKLRNASDWQFHESQDELFLVHRGLFVVEFR